MAPDGKYFTKTRKVQIHSNKRRFVTYMNDSEVVRRILGKWEKYWSFGLDEKFVGLDLEYRKNTEEVAIIQIGFREEVLVFQLCRYGSIKYTIPLFLSVFPLSYKNAMNLCLLYQLLQ